jgi:hypothetical protein
MALLIVETEVNGDSKSTKERVNSLVGSLGLLCRYKSCSVLAALDDPLQNTFYLTIHSFNSFVPIAQQAIGKSRIFCPDKATSENHVHKITNVPVFRMCQLSPKSRDFQGMPLPMALVMDLPASKSLRTVPYKQQVHL